MASIPTSVSLPRPIAWWQQPKVRARAIAALVLACVYGAGLVYGSWTRVCAGEHCPSISRLISAGDNVQMQTSKVYAADGRLISELGLERRTVLPLSEIPSAVRQAFVATEDKRFYSHHGIDSIGILRALAANLKRMRLVQGGSTITQQLAKNFFLTPTRSLWRKIREAELAVLLEIRYGKPEILEAYLNKIYLGQEGPRGIYGVEEAARFYFSKGVGELSLEESALLAGIISSPNRFSPLRRITFLRRSTKYR